MDSRVIQGGFILVARQRDNSLIAHCPPHFREIWDYLIRKASYTENMKCGTVLKRGQCFVSFPQIQEDLHWYVGYRKETYKKHHCEKAMKYFLKERMVETTKTTRGIIVTILNYDRFQRPENYERDTESDGERNKKATMERHYKQEGKERKKKDKDSLSSSDDLAQSRFSEIWQRYPEKDGKKEAFRHFRATVKTDNDWQNINRALDSYLGMLARPENSYRQPKGGKTWFNNWQDWLDRTQKPTSEEIYGYKGASPGVVY